MHRDKETELSERQAVRVIKQIAKVGPLSPDPHITIVPGKGTPTIAPIESPEEFFQRSGIRAGGDIRAGQPYVRSGSITFTVDGQVVVIRSGVPLKSPP